MNYKEENYKINGLSHEELSNFLFNSHLEDTAVSTDRDRFRQITTRVLI